MNLSRFKLSYPYRKRDITVSSSFHTSSITLNVKSGAYTTDVFEILDIKLYKVSNDTITSMSNYQITKGKRNYIAQIQMNNDDDKYYVLVKIKFRDLCKKIHWFEDQSDADETFWIRNYKISSVISNVEMNSAEMVPVETVPVEMNAVEMNSHEMNDVEMNSHEMNAVIM